MAAGEERDELGDLLGGHHLAHRERGIVRVDPAARDTAEISDMRVRTIPGATTYASTPSFAWLRATVCVRFLTAAFEAA